MTTSEVDDNPSNRETLADLLLIYGYLLYSYRVDALTVAAAAERSLPRIMAMLKEGPPPADPPRAESSVAIHEHNISALSQWVEGLETALHRVEERLETVEAYNSQSSDNGWKSNYFRHRRSGEPVPYDNPSYIDIYIDSEHYQMSDVGGYRTRGRVLLAVGEIDGEERDLWINSPGLDDDILVLANDIVSLRDGMRFFSTPRKINEG